MSLKATFLVVGGLLAYVALQPMLENWLGVDLPALVDDSGELTQTTAPAPNAGRTVDSNAPASTKAKGEPAAARDADNTAASPGIQPSVKKLGELRDIGGKIFESTAGLRYGPGSQEGHRTKHILRHGEDDPDRPIHGVFDGDASEIFAVIDEAYRFTFDHGPPQVSQENDDGRTIFLVDLGRRVGFVGGQSGKRKDFPAAHHIQLVLEGRNVITAYPIRIDRRRR